MKFMIQHNLLSNQFVSKIANAVKPFDHEFIGVIPFSHEITSDEPIVGTDYIPYGSTLFIDIVRSLGWKGLHFNIDTFNYTALCNNHSSVLNNHKIVSVADAVEFLTTRPSDELWFSRPSADLKAYSGAVTTADEWHTVLCDRMLCESSGSYKIPPDMEIVLSPPRVIEAEWRWFVVAGEVISGSTYKVGDKILCNRETDAHMHKTAQAFADVWLPDDCCVMDLARVDGKMYVVEFNCINASGFYDNDVDVIVKSLYNHHMRR